MINDGIVKIFRIFYLYVSIVNILKVWKVNFEKKVVIMLLYDGVYILVVYYVKIDEFIGWKYGFWIIFFIGYKYIIVVF